MKSLASYSYRTFKKSWVSEFLELCEISNVISRYGEFLNVEFFSGVGVFGCLAGRDESGRDSGSGLDLAWVPVS